MRVESIVYRGIKFRRYPDAKWHSDRVYFVPGGQHRKNGVGRLHEEIWKDRHGPIPPDHQIHHIDGNALNNDISNLQCLHRDEHRALHAAEQKPMHPRRLAWLEANRPKATQWHRSAEGRAWHREMAREVWKHRTPDERTCEQCGGTYLSRATQGHDRFCSNKCKAAWRRASGVDDEDRSCEACGTVFRVNRYSKQRACSRLCGSRIRTDRGPSKHPPE